MSNFVPFRTELSDDRVAAIPRGDIGMIDAHTTERALNTTPGNRPRIYAYIERGDFAGQIVALRSLDNFEQHDGTIGFAWTSANTLESIISQL